MQPSEPKPVAPQTTQPVAQATTQPVAPQTTQPVAQEPQSFISKWGPWMTVVAAATTTVANAEAALTTLSKYSAVISGFCVLAMWSYTCYMTATRYLNQTERTYRLTWKLQWVDQLLFLLMTPINCWAAISAANSDNPLKGWVVAMDILLPLESVAVVCIIEYTKAKRVSEALAGVDELQHILVAATNIIRKANETNQKNDK